MSNDLKSIHDFDFTMICNYFKLLERQGPGSPEVTQKAVSFINELSDEAKIADIGCGTGGQTMVLANYTKVCSSRDPYNPHYIKELKPEEYEVKLGDKAGDGTQLRPFIVWFGEAVPEFETAIQYVEKADIFVIIGTSLNVYPAAGLLHYVPREAEVYLIDPKPVDTHTSRPVHVIQKGASEGVAELKQLLGV